MAHNWQMDRPCQPASTAAAWAETVGLGGCVSWSMFVCYYKCATLEQTDKNEKNSKQKHEKNSKQKYEKNPKQKYEKQKYEKNPKHNYEKDKSRRRTRSRRGGKGRTRRVQHSHCMRPIGAKYSKQKYQQHAKQQYKSGKTVLQNSSIAPVQTLLIAPVHRSTNSYCRRRLTLGLFLPCPCYPLECQPCATSLSTQTRSEWKRLKNARRSTQTRRKGREGAVEKLGFIRSVGLDENIIDNFRPPELLVILMGAACVRLGGESDQEILMDLLLTADLGR